MARIAAICICVCVMQVRGAFASRAPLPGAFRAAYEVFQAEAGAECLKDRQVLIMLERIARDVANATGMAGHDDLASSELTKSRQRPEPPLEGNKAIADDAEPVRRTDVGNASRHDERANR